MSIQRAKRINKLNAALQANRDLMNEVHLLKQRQAPLEHELKQAKLFAETMLGEAKEADAELAKHRSRQRLSDAELAALAAIVNTEAVEATPARRMLQAELRLRGIVTEVPVSMGTRLRRANVTPPMVVQHGWQAGRVGICGQCGEALQPGEDFGVNGALVFHQRCMP